MFKFNTPQLNCPNAAHCREGFRRMQIQVQNPEYRSRHGRLEFKMALEKYNTYFQCCFQRLLLEAAPFCAYYSQD